MKRRGGILYLLLILLLTSQESLASIALGQSFASTRPFKPSSSIKIIQDIHAHPEAQHHIADLLSKLKKKNDDHLRVAVEGAHGPLQFHLYEAFPNRDLTEKISESYLNESRISAAEYSGLMQSGVEFVGVEKSGLYQANVKAYLAAKKDQPQLETHLHDLKSSLAKKKSQIFSQELLSFDRIVEQYHQRSLSFTVYVETLLTLSEEPSLSLEAYLTAAQFEKDIDYDRVKHEQKKFLHALMKKLTQREIQKLHRWFKFDPSLRDLVAIAESKHISLRSYPALQRYHQYVRLSESLPIEKIMKEAVQLEKTIYRQFSTNEQIENLINEIFFARLAQKLIRFELSPDEWHAYKKLNGAPSHLPLHAFETFYQVAEARDKAMYDELTKDHFDVLIVGGFHTPGLKKKFKEANRSIDIVRPKITKINLDESTSYLSVFSQKRTPLSKLLLNWKLFLAPPMVFGVRPLVQSEKSGLNEEFARQHMEAATQEDEERVGLAAQALMTFYYDEKNKSFWGRLVDRVDEIRSHVVIRESVYMVPLALAWILKNNLDPFTFISVFVIGAFVQLVLFPLHHKDQFWKRAHTSLSFLGTYGIMYGLLSFVPMMPHEVAALLSLVAPLVAHQINNLSVLRDGLFERFWRFFVPNPVLMTMQPGTQFIAEDEIDDIPKMAPRTLQRRSEERMKQYLSQWKNPEQGTPTDVIGNFLQDAVRTQIVVTKISKKIQLDIDSGENTRNGATFIIGIVHAISHLRPEDAVEFSTQLFQLYFDRISSGDLLTGIELPEEIDRREVAVEFSKSIFPILANVYHKLPTSGDHREQYVTQMRTTLIDAPPEPLERIFLGLGQADIMIAIDLAPSPEYMLGYNLVHELVSHHRERSTFERATRIYGGYRSGFRTMMDRGFENLFPRLPQIVHQISIAVANQAYSHGYATQAKQNAEVAESARRPGFPFSAAYELMSIQLLAEAGLDYQSPHAFFGDGNQGEGEITADQNLMETWPSVLSEIVENTQPSTSGHIPTDEVLQDESEEQSILIQLLMPQLDWAIAQESPENLRPVVVAIANVIEEADIPSGILQEIIISMVITALKRSYQRYSENPEDEGFYDVALVLDVAYQLTQRLSPIRQQAVGTGMVLAWRIASSAFYGDALREWRQSQGTPTQNVFNYFAAVVGTMGVRRSIEAIGLGFGLTVTKIQPEVTLTELEDLVRIDLQGSGVVRREEGTFEIERGILGSMFSEELQAQFKAIGKEEYTAKIEEVTTEIYWVDMATQVDSLGDLVLNYWDEANQPENENQATLVYVYRLETETLKSGGQRLTDLLMATMREKNLTADMVRRIARDDVMQAYTQFSDSNLSDQDRLNLTMDFYEAVANNADFTDDIRDAATNGINDAWISLSSTLFESLLTMRLNALRGQPGESDEPDVLEDGLGIIIKAMSRRGLTMDVMEYGLAAAMGAVEMEQSEADVIYDNLMSRAVENLLSDSASEPVLAVYRGGFKRVQGLAADSVPAVAATKVINSVLGYGELAQQAYDSWHSGDSEPFKAWIQRMWVLANVFDSDEERDYVDAQSIEFHLGLDWPDGKILELNQFNVRIGFAAWAENDPTMSKTPDFGGSLDWAKRIIDSEDAVDDHVVHPRAMAIWQGTVNGLLDELGSKKHSAVRRGIIPETLNKVAEQALGNGAFDEARHWARLSLETASNAPTNDKNNSLFIIARAHENEQNFLGSILEAREWHWAMQWNKSARQYQSLEKWEEFFNGLLGFVSQLNIVGFHQSVVDYSQYALDLLATHPEFQDAMPPSLALQFRAYRDVALIHLDGNQLDERMQSIRAAFDWAREHDSERSNISDLGHNLLTAHNFRVRTGRLADLTQAIEDLQLLEPYFDADDLLFWEIRLRQNYALAADNGHQEEAVEELWGKTKFSEDPGEMDAGRIGFALSLMWQQRPDEAESILRELIDFLSETSNSYEHVNDYDIGRLARIVLAWILLSGKEDRREEALQLFREAFQEEVFDMRQARAIAYEMHLDNFDFSNLIPLATDLLADESESALGQKQKQAILEFMGALNPIGWEGRPSPGGNGGGGGSSRRKKKKGSGGSGIKMDMMPPTGSRGIPLWPGVAALRPLVREMKTQIGTILEKYSMRLREGNPNKKSVNVEVTDEREPHIQRLTGLSLAGLGIEAADAIEDVAPWYSRHDMGVFPKELGLGSVFLSGSHQEREGLLLGVHGLKGRPGYLIAGFIKRMLRDFQYLFRIKFKDAREFGKAIDEGIAIVTKSDRTDDEDVRYQILGDLYRYAGRRDDAIAAYQKALEVASKPSRSVIVSLHNYALTDTGTPFPDRVQRAIELFNRGKDELVVSDFVDLFNEFLARSPTDPILDDHADRLISIFDFLLDNPNLIHGSIGTGSGQFVFFVCDMIVRLPDQHSAIPQLRERLQQLSSYTRVMGTDYSRLARDFDTAYSQGDLPSFLSRVEDNQYPEAEGPMTYITSMIGAYQVWQENPIEENNAALVRAFQHVVRMLESFDEISSENYISHQIAYFLIERKLGQQVFVDLTRLLLSPSGVKGISLPKKITERWARVAAHIGGIEIIQLFDGYVNNPKDTLHLKPVLTGGGGRLLGQMEPSLSREEWIQRIGAVAIHGEDKARELAKKAFQYFSDITWDSIEADIRAQLEKRQRWETAVAQLDKAEQALLHFDFEKAELLFLEINRDHLILFKEASAHAVRFDQYIDSFTLFQEAWQIFTSNDGSAENPNFGSQDDKWEGILAQLGVQLGTRHHVFNRFQTYLTRIKSLESESRPRTILRVLENLKATHPDPRRDKLEKRAKSDLEDSSRTFDRAEDLFEDVSLMLSKRQEDRGEKKRKNSLKETARLNSAWKSALAMSAEALRLDPENDQMAKDLLERARGLLKNGRDELALDKPTKQTFGPAHMRFDHAEDIAYVVYQMSANERFRQEAMEIRNEAQPLRVLRDLESHARILRTKLNSDFNRAERSSRQHTANDPKTVSLHFQGDISFDVAAGRLTVQKVWTEREEMEEAPKARAGKPQAKPKVKTVVQDTWQAYQQDDHGLADGSVASEDHIQNAPMVNDPSDYQIQFDIEGEPQPIKIAVRFVGTNDMDGMRFDLSEKDFERLYAKRASLRGAKGRLQYTEDFQTQAQLNALKPLIEELRGDLESKKDMPATRNPIVNRLLGLDLVERKKKPAEVEFKNKRLYDDPHQREVVEETLDEDADVVMVQGPPGTGKTTTIDELVRHLIEKRNRDKGDIVIVTNQSNYGLDNVGKKLLGKNHPDNDPNVEPVSMIRAASDMSREKIDESLKDIHHNRLHLLWQYINRHAETGEGFVYLATNNGLIFDSRGYTMLKMYLDGRGLREIEELYRRWTKQPPLVEGEGKSTLPRGRVRPVVIQEEGSMADVAESLMPLVNLDAKKYIGVGDPKQLPAKELGDDEVKLVETEMKHHGLRLNDASFTHTFSQEALEQQKISLLERAFEHAWRWGGVPTYMLKTARRWKWPLGLVSHLFYDNQLVHPLFIPEDDGSMPELTMLEHDDWMVVDMSKDDENRKTRESFNDDMSSWQNFSEVGEVVRSVTYHLNKGFNTNQMMLLSPYKGQNELIHQVLYIVGVLNDLEERDQSLTREELDTAFNLLDAHLDTHKHLFNRGPVSLKMIRQHMRKLQDIRNVSNRDTPELVRQVMEWITPIYNVRMNTKRKVRRADVRPWIKKEESTARTREDKEKESLEEARLSKKYAGRLMPQTIDSVQGQEKDVVIISFTRSSKDKSIGFLGTDEGMKRLNVALSRAKKKQVLIGSFDTLKAETAHQSGGSVFAHMLDWIDSRYRWFHKEKLALQSVDDVASDDREVRDLARMMMEEDDKLTFDEAYLAQLSDIRVFWSVLGSAPENADVPQYVMSASLTAAWGLTDGESWWDRIGAPIVETILFLFVMIYGLAAQNILVIVLGVGIQLIVFPALHYLTPQARAERLIKTDILFSVITIVSALSSWFVLSWMGAPFGLTLILSIFVPMVWHVRQNNLDLLTTPKPLGVESIDGPSVNGLLPPPPSSILSTMPDQNQHRRAAETSS